MANLTPAFVFRYEKTMRAIQEEELKRATEAKNLFWPKLSKSLDIQGASERLTWFLNTADIRPDGLGGTQRFEGLVTQTTELVPQRYIAGISVKRDDLLDLKQAGGLDQLGEWVRQITTKSVYLPQRLLTELLMNGAATDGSATAYDGIPFFQDTTATNGVAGHPYNPYKLSLGGYSNWLHGASGANGYPGACPIDSTTVATVDTAMNNFQKVIAYIRSWKMPDGRTPRFLTPAVLVHPPAMTARVAQMFDAAFIAMGAASGGGGADIQGFRRSWGTVDLIESQELASSTSYSTQIMMANQSATGQASGVITPYSETITGSDTTYYVGMRENMSSMLGGIVHIIREPWRVNYFSGDGSSLGAMTGLDAVLNRALEIEYHLTGRLSMQYGHPYTWIRVDAS